jgi:hypothetical protein
MRLDISKDPMNCETRITASFSDNLLPRLRDYIVDKVADRLALVMASIIWKEHGTEIMKHCDSHAIATIAMAKTQEILSQKAKELHRPEVVIIRRK